MKVEFIANACAVFESNSGTKIITDPWLNDGVTFMSFLQNGKIFRM